MIRIVTVQRLQALDTERRALEGQAVKQLRVEAQLRMELALVRQALTRAESEWKKWETRASRFIDQVGIKSGTIDQPAMTSPEPPPPSETRRVFSALGHTSLGTPPVDRPPHTPAADFIIGVDPEAARNAVAGVLEQ